MLPVELLGDRRDSLLCELPHGAPEQLVLLGEVEIHRSTTTGGGPAR